ncbi:MAG: hypothetical protein ACRDZ8_09700 [Acidimicrobiales bacterium]
MPAITRHLSVAVDDDDDDVDQPGDRIRDALGEDADTVEEVTVLAETRYEDLPVSAVERLGMVHSQKNILVGITLRHLERTLTDEEANGLRDRIYSSLHRGIGYQWASPTH